MEHRQELFTTNFQRIIFCQNENLSLRYSETFEAIKKSFENVELVNGLPNVSGIRRINIELKAKN